MKASAIVSIVAALCATVSALPSSVQDKRSVGDRATGSALDARATGPTWGPDLAMYFISSTKKGTPIDVESEPYIAYFHANINHHDNSMTIFHPMLGITAKWESSNASKDGKVIENCYTITGGGEYQPLNPGDSVVICFRFRRWSVQFSSWFLKSTNVHDSDGFSVTIEQSQLTMNGDKLKQDFGPLA
ncbi:uncharacterized protein L969DRAFT_94710 [Mixia osmundae IAM 14324]|nr:uncharacterized protein L969DRAFT_94710 [Mixia osmundae IAM 14324]KEI39661.1 hypothetical protein L969DRAFT_94710 [Mixia osmundae IAM 14324]